MANQVAGFEEEVVKTALAVRVTVTLVLSPT